MRYKSTEIYDDFFFEIKGKKNNNQSYNPALDKQFKCLFQTNSFEFDRRCMKMYDGVSVRRDVLPTIFEKFLKEIDLRYACYAGKRRKLLATQMISIH